VAEEEYIAIVISEMTVSTDDEALALHFPGSPTVRVCGRDLQPEAEQLADFGLG
jgi:hypothetical protein